MNILFIHQNFPGQFGFWAAQLAQQGHRVHALALTPRPVAGVAVHRYELKPPEQPMPGWMADLPAKFLRGHACANAMLALRKTGFVPDLVVAHPGWGEAMFIKDVWPNAFVCMYLEFYYRLQGQDVGFDPEFSPKEITTAHMARIRMRNAHQLMALDAMDVGLSPTHWQRSRYPDRDHPRIEVNFDGVDTEAISPNPNATFKLSDGTTLSKSDQVVTFVNRNLEPYRGYHSFVRMLPQLLKNHPKAQVVIVGEDGVSYGSAPPKGKTWKEIFWSEVRDTLDAARVHFVGRLERQALTSLLQVSSCHVYFTYPFVLSWSLVEAMSVACPIVASRTAPVLEVIDDGVHGLLADFFDPDAFVHAIGRVLNDQTLAQQLGLAARQKAQASYDLQRVCLPAVVKLTQTWLN